MVRSTCSNSDKPIRFEIDTDLNVTEVEAGADPMFCVALMNTARTKEPSILDIF